MPNELIEITLDHIQELRGQGRGYEANKLMLAYNNWRNNARKNDKRESLAIKNMIYRFHNPNKVKQTRINWNIKNKEEILKKRKIYYCNVSCRYRGGVKCINGKQ